VRVRAHAHTRVLLEGLEANPSQSNFMIGKPY